MDIKLTGRKALITGGSKGLGLAIARIFAEAGADIAIMARQQGPLDEAASAIEASSGRKALPVVCDVRRADEIAAGFAKVRQAFGHIDILVNNAGTSNAHPFETVTDEQWQEDLDLKLFAAIRLTRLAWPHMKQRKWGRVINVLNIGAKAPRPASAPTSVTRAAGMALTKVLAGEGAPHGILVNALLVGFIESDQWAQRAAKLGVPLADFLAKMGKEVPMGRVGAAQEFANAACFLASDAASYITGTAINVDGNRSPVV
ncbi:MAG TPA: SDR family oxidoreductase [Xanthobacteraceae bacterium]|jgi:NAD(P)-dependent dehydrogenase (short-subunit alcohol dehydrogenase family)|nr:SDR family oxidoreductase [Xanthobacteraceae bacterium]